MRCDKIVLIKLTTLLRRAFNPYCSATLSNFVRLFLYMLKTQFVLFFYCVLTKWARRMQAGCLPGKSDNTVRHILIDKLYRFLSVVTIGSNCFEFTE